MRKNILLLITLSFLLIAPATGYLQPVKDAGAQNIPLEVEKSIAVGTSDYFKAIDTIEDSSGYTDVLAGSEIRNGTNAFYAAKYINGQVVWSKTVFLINESTYQHTMFNDVADYLFAGKINGSMKADTLLVRLNQTSGALICQNIIMPGNINWNSAANAVSHTNSSGIATVVGAVILGEGDNQFSTGAYPYILDVNSANCSVAGDFIVPSIPGAFTDITIVDNSSSPFYGYKLISGYSITPNHATGAVIISPVIIAVDQANNIVGGKMIDFNTDAYATSVTYAGDKIVLGGAMYTPNGDTDGFIVILDSNLSVNSTFKLIGQANESIESLATMANGTIIYTGVLNENGQGGGNAAAGLLTVTGSLNKLLTYTGTQSKGYSITSDTAGRLHIAGMIRGSFPNSLTHNPALALQQSGNPQLAAYHPSVKYYPPIEDTVTVNVYSYWPVENFANYARDMGLYLVTGFEETPPPTTTPRPTGTTTHTTTTHTMTVSTTSITRTLTSTSTGNMPGCIDISTGTTGYMIPQPYGTVEDYNQDYPDWRVISPANATLRVASLSAWMEPSPNAKWITPYSDPQGNPIHNPPPAHYPPTTYQMIIALQVPSTLTMEWPADDTGKLYIDGALVQVNNAFPSTQAYTTGLPPGIHNLTIVVEDNGYFTGLYVDGKICPTSITTSTASRPTTTTATTPTNGTTGTGGQPCPCEDTITYAAAGVSGLFAAGWIITYMMIRRR